MTALPRSAALVVNARARKGRKLFRRAVRALKAEGVELVAKHAVRDPKTMNDVVRRVVAEGAPMVIVGGGDGSLSSTVDDLVGKDVVFGVLPLGTANSFARTLGIPLDLEGAIKVIAHGRRRRIDLGMIDDDYYANCAAIGISPLVAETVPHGLKAVFGRAGYLAWVVVQGFRFRGFKLTIVADGERHVMDASEVRVANGPYHGGTELVDDAAVDSGEIVVQVVLGSTRRALAWSWLASILKLRAKRRTTCEYHGQTIRIETDPPLPISIDGEVLAKTPATARVARGVVEVAVPA